MKVSEVVKKLQEMPPNAELAVYSDGWGGYVSFPSISKIPLYYDEGTQVFFVDRDRVSDEPAWVVVIGPEVGCG